MHESVLCLPGTFAPEDQWLIWTVVPTHYSTLMVSVSHRYTPGEMGWLKALSPPPDLEDEDEGEKGAAPSPSPTSSPKGNVSSASSSASAAPSSSAAEGPLPVLETLIDRHLVSASQQDQVLWERWGCR